MSVDLKETTHSAAPLTEVLVEQKKRQKKIERNPFDNDCITFTVESRERIKPAVSFLKDNRVVIVYDDTRASSDVGKIDVYLECISSRRVDDVIARLSEIQGLSNVMHSRIPIIRGEQLENVPWFPRCIGDLDESNENVIMCGTELEADHPGFKDQEYRKRRNFFTQLAMNYKCGDEIETVEYTEEETQTWSRVYNELTRLYPTHACQEQIANLEILAENCPGFDGKQVPQLSNVSKFLLNRTGFRMRPVAGFLTPRDFLAGLAFKVFNCTQYMRHSGDPFYTPEPDVCHELLGHVPLLADPSFAQFSQELGLASLGASDSDIKKLASCYLYTVEFGLCKENGQERAYGAGLLSCVAELKHALTSPEKMEEFIPEITAETDSFVTCFQPKYFVSETIDEVKFKMREFASSIKRPFDLEYDDATNTVRFKAPTAVKKDLEISHKISLERCDVTRTTVA